MTKKRIQSSKRSAEIPSKVLVRGKPFFPKQHKRECELRGENFRTHPDWIEFLKGAVAIRQKKMKEKRKLRKIALDFTKQVQMHDGTYVQDMELLSEQEKQQIIESGGKIALAKTANSIINNENEEMSARLRLKVKKAVVETIETAEIVKKIAKSKINKNLIDKAKRPSTRYLEEENENPSISLQELREIIEIFAKASKTQLDAANQILLTNPNDRKKIEKKVKEELTQNKVIHNKQSFDFSKDFIKQKEKEIEEISNDVSNPNTSTDKLLEDLDTIIIN